MGKVLITALVSFFLVAFPFLKGGKDYEERFFHYTGKGMFVIYSLIFYHIFL